MALLSKKTTAKTKPVGIDVADDGTFARGLVAKRQMRIEIKEISVEGSFEGLLSPYGNVDEGSDVVEPGAFTKTLQEHGNKVPMLWQHREDKPIGELTLEDRPDGLWCKGQLLMALPEAQKAYLLIKARIVKGLSIGFHSVKDAIENGVRRLKEIRLYEGSIVTFPMNEAALITAVKGRESKGDFSEELTEIQLGDASYQMLYALRCALESAIWSDLTAEEKIAASEIVLQQFTDTYMAYLPVYLDMLAERYGAMETWSKPTIQTKSGRMISAANKESIQAACDHIDASQKCVKSAQDLLLALIAAEAVEDDTSKAQAARERKSEPDLLHSAMIQIIEETKGALTWNL